MPRGPHFRPGNLDFSYFRRILPARETLFQQFSIAAPSPVGEGPRAQSKPRQSLQHSPPPPAQVPISSAPRANIAAKVAMLESSQRATIPPRESPAAATPRIARSHRPRIAQNPYGPPTRRGGGRHDGRQGEHFDPRAYCNMSHISSRSPPRQPPTV